MMSPVFIDITEVAEGISMTEDEVEDFSSSLSQKIEESFQKNWDKVVKENLHSTRSEYQRGMYIERIDSNTFEVGLTRRQSEMAMDIEEGKSPFDMKESFAKSSKKKFNKEGGWYLTIPLKVATPEALAESTTFANKMTKPIYKKAKNLKEGQQLKKNDLPSENQALGVRPSIHRAGKSYAAYEHKSPIFEGLQKGQKKNHGQYNTFRRVGSNSDSNSWIHKGFVAKNLMDKAWNQMDIESIVAYSKDEFLGI